jgi:hypothetical protein
MVLRIWTAVHNTVRLALLIFLQMTRTCESLSLMLLLADIIIFGAEEGHQLVARAKWNVGQTWVPQQVMIEQGEHKGTQHTALYPPNLYTSLLFVFIFNLDVWLTRSSPSLCTPRSTRRTFPGIDANR